MINRLLRKYDISPIKYCFVFVFVFLCSINNTFSQEITVKKYITENVTNCYQYDVTLEITGNPNLRPQEVILVIDVSGSMDDAPGSDNDPIDYAQDAAIEFVKNFFLPENNPTGLNKVSLVTFSNNSRLVVPLTNASGKETIINAINNLTVGGKTNTEAGILEADKEFTNNGTFNCETSRSIILLSDGVSTARVGDSDCNYTTVATPCQTEAIEAGINAQTKTVLGEIYQQSIFTIGLVGTISDIEKSIALNTLNDIQNAGAYYTNENADLTDIYSQILGQLVAAATQLPNQALVSDYIQSGFSIIPETLTTNKGNASHLDQVVSWFVETVLKETMTLSYTIKVNNTSVCGDTIVGNTIMDYKNSMCDVSHIVFENPNICIPCPQIQPSLNLSGNNSINYSTNLSNGTCVSLADSFLWEFYLNEDLIGTSNIPNGTYNDTGNLVFDGVITAKLTYNGTYPSGCTLPEITEQVSLTIANDLVLNITSQSNIDCTNNMLGEIVVEATGGNPPYAYTIDDGINYENSGLFSSLEKGNYTIKVIDISGSNATITTTLINTDTIAPVLTSNIESEITSSCFNIPEAPTPYFIDNNSQNITVVFSETNGFDGTNRDFEILRKWNVSDECSNTATFSQKVFVTMDASTNHISDDRCINDGIIDLNKYLTGTNNNGTWSVKEGNAVISRDHLFDPSLSEIGDYSFNYSVIQNGCIEINEITIALNNECIVLPCGEDMQISKALTPNGDMWNEYFEIKGNEYCDFEIELKIFNRWGTLIYESYDYKNDWNGTDNKSSGDNSSKKIPNGTYYYVVNLKNSGLNPITGPLLLATK